jgi:hypothetical protein
MAFPYVYESDFETGTTTGEGWDSETDTASQLDIAHYKTLANLPWPTCAPFKGAYALRATLSGGTADAFLTEGDINIAADGTNYFRFYIWLSPTFTGTANDTINIFEGIATATVEFTFGLRVVAATNVVNFGIGETAPTSFTTQAIERGVWYCIELAVHVDDGASNNGTIDLYLTKEGEPSSDDVAATQVASLDQGAITSGVLGVQDHLATTTGTILIDQFVQDDARVYPITRRFDDTVLLTKSGHAFVGRGIVDNITLMSGAGTDSTNTVAELKNTANNELVDPAGMPVDCVRGAYVVLSGTTPRARVKIKNVAGYGSPGAVRGA